MSKTSARSIVRRRMRTAGPRRVAKESVRGHGTAIGTSAANSSVTTNGARWTFLTNHTHVLILLGRDPSMVLREVAGRVGITERAVQRIIADLEEGGILEREKIGRKNHYKIHRNQKLRHPIERHRSIGALLQAL